MPNSRIQNTKRNIIWSYVDYLVTVIFQFVSRTIIIHVLGTEYLGLSSLFTSILQVLNMAELGFASAIIYNMYKPIANADTKTVCALLSYYKKVYHVVGMIVVSTGLIIMPFLPHLITGGWPECINLYILYILYLANTGISYFLFAYKTSLLNALQRLDLTKISYCIVNVVQYSLQVVSLIVLKNYYLFVVSLILGTVLKNVFTAYIAKKKFPQYVCAGEINKETKQSIIEKVKGLMICNISGVTYTTFDSIILSTFIGLSAVAIYNNYLTIYTAVANIILLIRNAMQASVGNSVAGESIEKNHTDIQKWQFLFSVIAIWCSNCMLCLYQPFMKMWMGEGMLLPMVDVILISSWFFISTVQHAFFLYLSATGLWWKTKWAYILSTISNLIWNIVLCQFMGTTGIILATFISTFVFGIIWQCIVIFKEYFKRSALQYLLKQLLYFGSGVLVWIISFVLCKLIYASDALSIVLRILICTLITLIVIYIFYGRTKAFAQCKELAIRVIRR